MKISRDFICPKCGAIKLSVLGEYQEYPKCDRCRIIMDFFPTSINVSTFFPGSHNAEYGTSGKKFKGCTKDQVLAPITEHKKKIKKKAEGQ